MGGFASGEGGGGAPMRHFVLLPGVGSRNYRNAPPTVLLSGDFHPPRLRASQGQVETAHMNTDIRALTERVQQESGFVELLNQEAGKVIVGQRYMLERILIGLLCNGHVLLEGVPGLAKTLTVRTISDTLSATFARIQFTPDLLPADLVGTMIYNQQAANFTVRKGPVFANVVLADEINRAPAKVQSALLEAMQERPGHHRGTPPSHCPRPSWCSPPRTPSSRRAPTRCPRPRWTASCSR